MPYELPPGFLEGRTAIRVGYRVKEFIEYFNKYISPDNPSWDSISDFRFMTDKYGDDVAISCNYYDDYFCCEWCYGTWYAKQGYDVVDFEELDNSEPLDSILDLL